MGTKQLFPENVSWEVSLAAVSAKAASFFGFQEQKILAGELDKMYGRRRSSEDTAKIINGRAGLILSEDE